MTLRHDDQSITFKVGDTKTFSYNIIESVKRIDVIDVACEEYAQEVLGFSDTSKSGNPTPTSEPIVSTSSPTLTPFGDSDFLLEETDAFLAIEDEPISSEIDDSIYDSEGDTLYLEELLSVINSDPNLPPLPICEINVPKKIKSSCDDLPDLELKDLPSHLEYAFLEGNDKLSVIIAKNLKDEDKAALIKIKKRPHSLVLMECLPTVACLSVYAMHRALPKVLMHLHDLTKKTIEVFMDDFFSLWGNPSKTSSPHFDQDAPKGEDTNLFLNWEKSPLNVHTG
ncbi:hypothetical protein Tco_0922615 [Tanacetum coccineum]|uniref:Reverse transcriptase domain-containing protein n=1 Tax=Tanacetum coccineum TaxID=301880 RepID=A0ABQ5CYM7_9ASTR